MDESVLETTVDVISSLSTEALELSDLVKLMISVIPVGFALGFACLLLGLGISGILKIFNRA